MSHSKPASDRVLFNEDHLGMILLYLSTADLKNARLVTPFWNKIGTKFLGRKCSFKPIRLSDLTFEGWVSLMREIEASRPEDPRIKLFQAFDLTWSDAIMMSYHNFISPFKPSRIIIEGPKSPPSGFYSLSFLLSPILDTLTDVTLKINWSVLRKDFPILENFANLEGMRLKRLNLEISENEKSFGSGSASALLQILSNLLTSQAPTLEELHLKIVCKTLKDVKVSDIIQLPIFPHLHNLFLFFHSYISPMNEFHPFNFSEKFPKLEHLQLNSNLLVDMSWAGKSFDLTKGHSLKKLGVIYGGCRFYKNPEIFNMLQLSFPLVEEFTVQDLMNGPKIPCWDTLKNLKISRAYSTFNLVHLKKIETIYYNASQDSVSIDVQGLFNRLLNHFEELTHLRRLYISSLNITAEQIVQIQEALPAQFRDILFLTNNKESDILIGKTYETKYNYGDTTSGSDTDTDTDY